MTIDEAMRHRIHGRLEALLGPEEAAALMGALPVSDVATRNDLEHVREVLQLQIERSTAELGTTLRAEMNQLYRWTVGSMFAAVSLGLAAGRLLAG
jgi:hypothetical protein